MTHTEELQKIDNIIGKKLKSIRVAQGYTLESIQALTKFSVEMLSYYESGKRPIPANRLKKLAEIFEVDVSVFFEGCTKVELANSSPRLLQINKKLAKIDNPEALAFIKSACDFALKK